MLLKMLKQGGGGADHAVTDDGREEEADGEVVLHVIEKYYEPVHPELQGVPRHPQ